MHKTEDQSFRSMSMPINLSSCQLLESEIQILRQRCKYQPFILPDGSRTGVALGQHSGAKERIMMKSEEGTDLYKLFVEKNENLASMYEEFISAAKTYIGDFEGLTFSDVACNAGYFCYRFMQEGVKYAYGYDRDDYVETIDIINRCLGVSVEFKRTKYDMQHHFIEGFQESDIVLCASFICHSSDPTFLIDFLAKQARKAIILYSTFPKSGSYFVRYGKDIKKYGDRPYPLCFDDNVEVSDSLLKLALTENGFSHIYELERKDTWLPKGDSWRCFIGVR